MAYTTFHFKSKVLEKDTAVNVILPLRYNDGALAKDHRSPVLFLLHGLSDDYTSWMRMSSIERYVRHKNLAVVMPDADRTFYANTKSGRRYFDYITKELPEVMEHIFPIYNEKKHRFVAGFSMGGYGALKCALTPPYNYRACASFSGAVDIYRVHSNTERMAEVLSVLGSAVDEENDLMALVQNAGKNIPPIYQSCGMEDFLYKDNLTLKSVVEPVCPDYYFEDGHGMHSWDYWDKHIEKAIGWFEKFDPDISIRI